jgi:hypothetical protein
MHTLGRVESFVMLLLRDDGQCAVTLTYERLIVRTRERVTATVNVASRLRDDRRAVTTANPRALGFLPEIIMQMVPGRTLEHLMTRHFDWIAASGWTTVRIPEDTLEDTVLERERAVFDRHIERGLYVPISERAYAALAQSTPPELPPPSRARNVLNTIQSSLWWIILLLGGFLIYGDVGRMPWASMLPAIILGLFITAVALDGVRRLLSRPE